ncbi:hypothetical protein WJX84_004040 [Apatococcus fuscideae]|uniref:Uncharacterized protein n=1 Tax=Apatococcus fuscideae TaxID=2026836 RepID=A0AAW1T983_9CHLO
MHSSPAPYCDPWELEAYSLLLFPEAQPTQADAVPSLRESEGFSGAPWPGASSEGTMLSMEVSQPGQSRPGSGISSAAFPAAGAKSAAAAVKAVPRPTAKHYPPARRPRHLSSLREVELGAIVAALQQPPGHEASGQLECLAALEEMATITKMPGNGRLTQAEKLRRFSFQRMFVQPGWNAIIPCSATITQVYLALATGKMDLDIQLSEVVHGRQKSLRDLATIPESQHVPLFAEMSRRIVNAMHFKRAEDDAAHRTSLKYTGVVGLLGSVFFRPKGSLHFHGKNLLDGRPKPTETESPDPSAMKRVLHLDDCQIEMARPVWRQASAQLGKLQAQRAEILSQIQLNDTQPLMWHDPARYRASHTVTLLEQGAPCGPFGRTGNRGPLEPHEKLTPAKAALKDSSSGR